METQTYILLLAREGPAATACIDQLAALSVVPDRVVTYDELRSQLMQRPYNGILVDLATKLRLPRERRHSVEAMLALYPTANFRFEAATGGLHLVIRGQGTTESDLKAFIDGLAVRQTRRMRSAQRMALHLNVVVSQGSGDGVTQTRTSTLGVSEGGCFLIATDPWPPGTALTLRFLELDGPPVEVEVTWARPWGQERAIPGSGVRFVSLTEDQLETLRALMATVTSEE